MVVASSVDRRAVPRTQLPCGDAARLLAEDDGVPMVGSTVAFTLQGRTVVATTDTAGRAEATMSAPDHGRSQVVDVSFAATARHAASATAATVTWGAGRP